MTKHVEDYRYQYGPEGPVIDCEDQPRHLCDTSCYEDSKGQGWHSVDCENTEDCITTLHWEGCPMETANLERRFFGDGQEVYRGTPAWDVAPMRYPEGIMCAEVGPEGGVCVRAFPQLHVEHASEDGTAQLGICCSCRRCSATHPWAPRSATSSSTGT
jgi:hypothetical protein